MFSKLIEAKDPELKGKRDGNCNRTACQDTLFQGTTYFNKTMGAYYCRACAWMINAAGKTWNGEDMCIKDDTAGRPRDQL